jgi:hypothetical protein
MAGNRSIDAPQRTIKSKNISIDAKIRIYETVMGPLIRQKKQN